MKLPVKKLHPKAVIPTFATPGAACFDLVAISREGDTYSTGLAFDIPAGYCILVFSRSGHGFKDNTRLCNCVGVIDSDYRGEVKVKLTRDDGKKEMPWVGDRVAQAMLMRLPKTEITEVEDISDTQRGEGGFGSTGR
jgi:dUTP pyrophosphatase